MNAANLKNGRNGRKNIKPSRDALRRYWIELRAAADAGDVAAMAAMIALAESRPVTLILGAPQIGAVHA